ncbi:MAG: DUF2807 domain-containing protein [Prevotella sp.]|jgi:hypothetical protein|nr:DUF2807 domain-containing protein [Prevotella sp.]
MKKVLFAVLTLGMLTSCSCHGVKTNWYKTEAHGEETRSITGFERIALKGSLDVKYMQDDSFMVKVDAPVEVIKDVETRVEGNVLKIRMKGEGKFLNFGVSDSDDITVYVTSPDFLGISLQGSGDFECQGLLDTDNLDIELQGSGDIEFDDIICDKIDVSVLGSGDVKLKNVKTQQSVNEVVGSGDIKIHYDNSGNVQSSIVGSGDITLSGQVQRSFYEIRGSGDMKTGNLLIQEEKTETRVK